MTKNEHMIFENIIKLQRTTNKFLNVDKPMVTIRLFRMNKYKPRNITYSRYYLFWIYLLSEIELLKQTKRFVASTKNLKQ